MLDALLRLLFPERCVACETWGELFCGPCQQQLVPYTAPKPNHFPLIDHLAIGYLFEGGIRAAIHAFKYQRRKTMAIPLGRLIVGEVRAIAHIDTRPVLIGVPLHPRREAERGFNQAHELAATLASSTGLPVLRGELVRRRDTGQQAKRTARERRINMEDAFQWQGRTPPRSVVLVDDVVTTGATFEACAIALRAAGVQRVCGVALARS